MVEFDLGIHCDYFLSMAGGKVQIERDIFVGVTGSLIAEIAPWKSKQWKAAQLIDAKNQVIMPGLINGHTHLAMTLFRGLADDHPFSEWIFKYILPMEGKFVSQDFVRVGTELGIMESIRFGVTTLCDMYYFEDVVADVMDRFGVRGLAGQAIADFPAPDDKQNQGNAFKCMERMAEKYKGHSRVTPAFGPHAPYTCSDETLKKVRELALQTSLPVMIHVSETKNEVAESIQKFSKTPAHRLSDLGFLELNPIFAHGVHLTESEIELMAKNGGSVIYNPESNMKLGSGVAPIPQLLKAGVPVGVGTDGAASNNDLSILSELDSGAKLQKLKHEDNTAMTAVQALSLATLGGAQALGLDKVIGSLEKGKRADLIAVDFGFPHLQPIHDVASQLVYSATGLEVRTVICEGRILMKDCQYSSIDSEKIYSEANRYRDLIQESAP